MGRGGYNGGSASVKAPKSDNVYILTDTEDNLYDQLLRRSRIVESGENLESEKGGCQPEFGYVLKADIDQTKERRAFLNFIWTSRPGHRDQRLKWVDASTLLSHPKGIRLARKYHYRHPEAPQP